MAALTAVGCGGSRQDANEPSGNFPIRVALASFPTHQRLATNSVMKITLVNAGNKSVPNPNIEVSGARGSTQSAEAFSAINSSPGLANPSRPVWILDQGPFPGLMHDASGGTTAYTNTWALGHPLAPGKSATFIWHVTAVRAGHWTLNYVVDGGLNGKAHAVLPGGGVQPTGSFSVVVSSRPAQTIVAPNGAVVPATPQPTH